MLVYDPLWVTMKKRKITKYRLRKDHDISEPIMDRLKHNRPVSMGTLDRLCNELHCNIEDIVVHVPDNKF